MKLADLSSARTIAIYGMGKEGHSSAQFMQAHFQNLAVTLHDDTHPSYVPITDWDHYDVIILSSGIHPQKIPGSFRGVVTSNAQIFFANLTEDLRKRVIGISGTKGKSTTVKFCLETLLAAGQRAVAAGNYGLPFLDVYAAFIGGEYDYIVAELSSYQLEKLDASPGIAIFLNLFQDHLDRHETTTQYLEAKAPLWRFQKPDDLLIIPSAWAKFAATHQLPSRGQQLLLAEPLAADYFQADSIFRAEHFLANFGTVQSLATWLKIPDQTVQAVAQRFIGLPHRLEFVAERSGIRWYDDSISTNPDSTLPAVNFFGTTLGSIILGGTDRHQDFHELIKQIAKLGAQIIVYQSETSPRLIETAQKLGYAAVTLAKTFDEAVVIAAKLTPVGKACLLSAAAPSYDKFKNFEARGTRFQGLVRALAK